MFSFNLNNFIFFKNIPTNQNRLAELIREISQQRFAVPCLNGTEPLELLLEIGLEKLAKDYEYIFTECKICSSKDLLFVNKKNNELNNNLNVRKTLVNSAKQVGSATVPSMTNRKTLMHHNGKLNQSNAIKNVGFQNSTFEAINVQQKLARLAHVHLLLEHLLSIQSNLNLDNSKMHIFIQN